MKKNISLALLVSLLFLLSSASLAADKAKTAAAKAKPAAKPAAAAPVKPIQPVTVPVPLLVPAPQPSAPAIKLPVTSKNGWYAKGGLFGSAVRIGGGYEKALNDRTALCFDTGYGIGNNYILVYLSGGLIYKFQNRPDRPSPFAGIALSYADFSNRVVDVPGVGNITKGGAAGLAVTFGVMRGNFSAEIGYDTRTGYLAGIKFGIGR